MSIDWEDFGIYEWDGPNNLPTDWVHVLSLTEGGYEWTALRAFWSPTKRRYFWHGGSGCSCNSWGDRLRSESDFKNGDRQALRKAIRDFADENKYSLSGAKAIDAVDKLARFKETK